VKTSELGHQHLNQIEGLLDLPGKRPVQGRGTQTTRPAPFHRLPGKRDTPSSEPHFARASSCS
jgi:hypothetical protein